MALKVMPGSCGSSTFTRMEYRNLGKTGTRVSSVCPGTKTFGTQNYEAEDHAQLDRAV